MRTSRGTTNGSLPLLAGLAIAVLLLTGVVARGTYALFSDTESSTGNTFTTGTLDLVSVISGTATACSVAVTEQGDGLNDKVEFGSTDPIEPGSSGTVTWTLTNAGTVGGTLTMAAVTTFDEGGTPSEPEQAAETALGGVRGLGDMLEVWVTRNGTDDILGTSSTYVAMNGLAAALNAESQSLINGTPLVYVLHWQVPTSVGNEIQGDSAELDITFTLTQS